MEATVLYTYMYLEGCKKITLLPHTEKKRKKCYPSAKEKYFPHTQVKNVSIKCLFFFSLRPVVKCHFANDGEEERNKHISSSMLCTVVSPNIKF